MVFLINNTLLPTDYIVQISCGGGNVNHIYCIALFYAYVGKVGEIVVVINFSTSTCVFMDVLLVR